MSETKKCCCKKGKKEESKKTKTPCKKDSMSW